MSDDVFRLGFFAALVLIWTVLLSSVLGRVMWNYGQPENEDAKLTYFGCLCVAVGITLFFVSAIGLVLNHLMWVE